MTIGNRIVKRGSAGDSLRSIINIQTYTLPPTINNDSMLTPPFCWEGGEEWWDGANQPTPLPPLPPPSLHGTIKILSMMPASKMHKMTACLKPHGPRVIIFIIIVVVVVVVVVETRSDPQLCENPDYIWSYLVESKGFLLLDIFCNCESTNCCFFGLRNSYICLWPFGYNRNLAT